MPAGARTLKEARDAWWSALRRLWNLPGLYNRPPVKAEVDLCADLQEAIDEADEVLLDCPDALLH